MNEPNAQDEAMDPSTTVRLVSLRFLLAEASARVSDQSVMGRHTAIILLDGACELAMGIALDERGGDQGKTFEASYSNLRARLGDSWKHEVQTTRAWVSWCSIQQRTLRRRRRYSSHRPVDQF